MPWPKYFDHNGGPCPHPKTKEGALRDGCSKYQRPANDPRCPHDGCEVYYTETDECVFCMAKKNWGHMLLHPQIYPTSAHMCQKLGTDYFFTPVPCPNGAHLVTKYNDDRRGCATCRQKPSPRQIALDKGEVKYLPDRPCKRCGKRALKRVDNGRCDGCGDLVPLSQRQKAIKAGESWYLPKTPCKHCDQIALKRVYDGACQGCNPDLGKGYKNAMNEPTRLLMENAPATVIDRDTAIKMDLSAYRTGKPCTHGHTGWRYVSTRNCMDCRKKS